MPEQSDPLVAAARRLLDELMPILRQQCPAEQDRPLSLTGWPNWIPEPDIDPGVPRRYLALPRVISAEQQCAARLLRELREGELPSVAALDRLLAVDEVIGPRLDHEISSSGGGGQTWQAQALIQQLVDQVVGTAPLFNLPSSVRDEATTRWAKALRRSSDPGFQDL